MLRIETESKKAWGSANPIKKGMVIMDKVTNNDNEKIIIENLKKFKEMGIISKAWKREESIWGSLVYLRYHQQQKHL